MHLKITALSFRFMQIFYCQVLTTSLWLVWMGRQLHTKCSELHWSVGREPWDDHILSALHWVTEQKRYDSAVCCSNMFIFGHVAAANSWIVLSFSVT